MADGRFWSGWRSFTVASSRQGGSADCWRSCARCCAFVPRSRVADHRSRPPSRHIHQPPNGSGPQCSASGPNAATGRKSNAPMITIVRTRSEAKVNVASRKVPMLRGLDFLAPGRAAIAGKLGSRLGPHTFSHASKNQTQRLINRTPRTNIAGSQISRFIFRFSYRRS